MRSLIDLIPIDEPTATAWSEIPLTEYQHVTVNWESMTPYDGGHRLGSISTKFGLADIMARRSTSEMGLWAVIDDEAIGFVGLKEVDDYVILANAFVDPKYANRGVVSEIVHFVIRVMKVAVLSDTQVSSAGITLIKSMQRNFDTKIIYVPTGEKFNPDDAGKAITTDGHRVLDPADDFIEPDFYDRQTGKGQRFFFIYEGRDFVREGMTFGCDRSRHLVTRGWSMLPGYFGVGDI